MASFLTTLGRIIRSVTGIKDLSLFRKNVVSRTGRVFYRRKYTADDLVAVMKQMGMTRGSLVCIHASMKQFYNYVGTPDDLIDAILSVIGEEGTLVMPAYPVDVRACEENRCVFDIRNTPTGGGLLAETFRLRLGVKRSINVRHSACAYGPLADYLLSEHYLSETVWDERSPYYRMCEKGALIFSLGLPYSFIGTFDHCVESLLRREYPYYAQFFTPDKHEFHYIDVNGALSSYMAFGVARIDRRTHESRVFSHFDKRFFQTRYLSNLRIRVCYGDYCLKRMLELGRRGITIYYVPSPNKYKFTDV